ncbi:MAG: hypothetical protein KJ645_13280 [Planctomycetes bacterium]|nr:hypothetical protein [Planctomycetota bacterium]
MKPLIWLSLMLLFPWGNDVFEEGVQAYREGRFQKAVEAFARAEKAKGPRAPAELLYDQAMALFRAGDLVKAEYTAEKALVRGGETFEGMRDFLFGNTAFKRCETAEARASGPEAEPFAFEEAILHAESARDAWIDAALSRPDWPEAARNVERALLKLEQLKIKQAAAKRQNKKTPDQKMNEAPPCLPPPGATDPGEEEVKVKAVMDELPAEGVQRLLEKLAEKEKEKMAVRKARQARQQAEVEKNW